MALEASQAQIAEAAAVEGEGEGAGGEVMNQSDIEAERQSLQNTITDLQQLTLQLKEQNAAMVTNRLFPLSAYAYICKIFFLKLFGIQNCEKMLCFQYHHYHPYSL